MYSAFSKSLAMLLILCGGFFIACQQEEEVVTADTFVSESVEEIESRSGTGYRGCYELVFPLTIQFRDSTTAEVASYEEMRQAIRDWYEASGVRPGRHDRPVIVLPFQVINQDGELITIETPEQLEELKNLCRPHGGPGNHGDPGNHGNHGNHGPCFEVVYPVTVSFPDSSQVTVNSKQELREVVRAYNEANPGQHVHPVFVFPITVTLRDGTQVVANTPEELRAIKEACRG